MCCRTRALREPGPDLLDAQRALRCSGPLLRQGATTTAPLVDEKPAGYALAGDHPRLTGEEFMAQVMGGGES